MCINMFYIFWHEYNTNTWPYFAGESCLWRHNFPKSSCFVSCWSNGSNETELFSKSFYLQKRSSKRSWFWKPISISIFFEVLMKDLVLECYTINRPVRAVNLHVRHCLPCCLIDSYRMWKENKRQISIQWKKR